MSSFAPFPGRGSGSGPAYDDTAIVQRLDVLEANRSTSEAFRPELRSRVGGLTLESNVDLIAPAGYLTFYVRSPGAAGEIYVTLYNGGTIADFIELVEMHDYDGFLEVLLDDGHLIIRPLDASIPLHITTSSPDQMIEAFDIDETWFGQDVYPRVAGTYDTTSMNVRLDGPDGAYAPGSGQSVSTALEALKRLHHSSDTIIFERRFWSPPAGVDLETATVGDIGAEIGSGGMLSWVNLSNWREIGEVVYVEDLDELVTDFVNRIPGIAFTTIDRDVVGRQVLAFYVSGDIPWQLSKPVPDGYGRVTIEIDFGPGRLGETKMVLSRVHSDDVFTSVQYFDPAEDYPFYYSGQLSSVLGGLITELRHLRSRVAELENGQ